MVEQKTLNLQKPVAYLTILQFQSKDWPTLCLMILAALSCMTRSLADVLHLDCPLLCHIIRLWLTDHFLLFHP